MVLMVLHTSHRGVAALLPSYNEIRKFPRAVLQVGRINNNSLERHYKHKHQRKKIYLRTDVKHRSSSGHRKHPILQNAMNRDSDEKLGYNAKTMFGSTASTTILKGPDWEPLEQEERLKDNLQLLLFLLLL